MRIIKPSGPGVVTRVFREGGIDRFGVAIPILINLHSCSLASEQDLWTAAAALPGGVLDAGLPKPHAEYLVSFDPSSIDGADDQDLDASFCGAHKRLSTSAPAAAAEFGPLAWDHPDRMALYGSSSIEALKDDPFNLPQDLDRAWLNIAPRDQQTLSLASIPDGSRYTLCGFDTANPKLQGCLPAFRARSFVLRSGANVLESVSMRLTTAWFLPARAQAILVFHGEATLAVFDASDIRCLIVALEDAMKPKGDAHYANVHRLRSEGDDAALHALRDADLLPDAHASAVEVAAPTLPAWQSALSRRAESERRRAARNGLHLATPTPTPLPTRAEIAAFVADQRTRASQVKAACERTDAQLRARMDRAGSMGTTIQPPAGPPGPIRSSAQLPGKVALDPAEAQNKLEQIYRRSAQHQAAAPSMDPPASAEARAEMKRRMADAQSLAGMDLTGADLSGMDLSGQDLTGALMEGADLTDVNLGRARLCGAVLVRARMHRTRIGGADLTEANLSLADCVNTDFARATLASAVCEKTIFDHPDFSGAQLDRTHFEDCQWREPRFDMATLDRLVLRGQDLHGASFRGATLRKVTFCDCNLSGAWFCKVTVDGMALANTSADCACFADATVSKACFIQGSRLDGASFRGATLKEVNLRNASALGLDLGDATLEQCDLSGADLACGSLQRIRSDGVLFERTCLQGADLRDGDFIGAWMRGADLRNAAFKRTNLFRSVLAETELAGASGLADAYTEHATWSRARWREGDAAN